MALAYHILERQVVAWQPRASVGRRTRVSHWLRDHQRVSQRIRLPAEAGILLDHRPPLSCDQPLSWQILAGPEHPQGEPHKIRSHWISTTKSQYGPAQWPQYPASARRA